MDEVTTLLLNWSFGFPFNSNFCKQKHLKLYKLLIQ